MDNKLNYPEIETLAGQTDLLKNKGLSVSSITELIKLKVRLKEHLANIKQIQLAIMDKYEVVEEDGTYNYAKHKDVDLIKKDLTDAIYSKIEVSPLNFIPIKELITATSDLTADVVTSLYQKLGKEE